MGRSQPVQTLRRVVTPGVAPATAPCARPSVRHQIRFCTATDGVRLAYAIGGSGPPLVKAANWIGHLEYDQSTPVWRHWVAELSRDHCLLRYDVRGCGLSDRAVEDLSFEALVSDFETVVEASGFTRFSVLGISSGVPLAIAYAALHPERVSHLVLHAGFTRGPALRPLTPDQREINETMPRVIELGWGQENPSFRQLFTSQFIPGGTPEQQRSFSELARLATSPQNAARLLRMIYRIDVADRAAQVRCPTLVLHSAGDARARFDEGRLLAGLVPGARFVPVASNNHIPLEHEAGWRAWLDEVRAFLPAPQTDAFAELTARERELLDLIAAGLTNPQIATCLALSAKTVKNHITSIFAKLGIENRARAIVLGRDAGLGRAGSQAPSP